MITTLTTTTGALRVNKPLPRHRFNNQPEIIFRMKISEINPTANTNGNTKNESVHSQKLIKSGKIIQNPYPKINPKI